MGNELEMHVIFLYLLNDSIVTKGNIIKDREVHPIIHQLWEWENGLSRSECLRPGSPHRNIKSHPSCVPIKQVRHTEASVYNDQGLGGEGGPGAIRIQLQTEAIRQQWKVPDC